MKFIKIVISIIAAFLAILVLAIPLAYAEEKPIAPSESGSQLVQEQTKVMGRIIANKDETGKIVGYFLQEAGGLSAAVSSQGKGEELQNLVGKRVEVIGTLEESQGDRTITVTEFKEIE